MARQRVHLESPVAQALQIVPVGIGDRFARLALRVGEQRQRPLGGDARIELAQAAGGGVARIGEHLLPRGGLRLVHLEEVRLGHEDLAADLDQRRRAALQPRRHRLHRAEIGGDVLALGAVAARRAAHEAAVLVGQVDRQPVDLRFGDERQRRVRRKPDEAARARAELGELVGVIALSSDSIGTRWRTLAKPLSGAPPTRLDGESARIRCGKRASIAALRRRSASYSASVISGASCSWYSRSWCAISLRQPCEFDRGVRFGQVVHPTGLT